MFEIETRSARPRGRVAHWRVRWIAALTGLLLLASACAGGGERPAEEARKEAKERPFTIAVVFYTKTIPYYQQMLEGLQTKAKELGINLKVSYANFDVTRQYDLLQNAAAKSPDGIIAAPMDRDALIPVIRQAHEADIPVITVGDEVAQQGKQFVVSYVGQIYHEMGEMKATWLAEKLGGQGKILVVHGPRGLDYVEAQREAYEQVFKEHPGIEVVEGSYGNFSSEVGLKTTENLLSTHPRPDAIWFDNDDLAIGGVRGVRERGIPFEDVVLVSSDGTKAAWQAVQQGTLDYTISIRPYAVGLRTIEVFDELLTKNTKPSYHVEVPMVEITRENAKKLTWDQIR